MTMLAKKSYVTVTDQFCGAGGSSLGAVAHGAEVSVALNHWKRAIETHQTNFPNTFHECTDISACDPRRYPSTNILITSPECTSHTLAKGRKRKNMAQTDLWGKNGIDPAEERSRATMWDVPRFAEHHRYEIVIVENVVDAALYWPLFEVWLQAMSVLGYSHELVCLNSMFAHPTPQSRDRLYVVFWRTGNRRPNLAITPAAWCPQCQRDVASVQSWKASARRVGGYHVGKYGHHGQYLYRCPLCSTTVTPYYYAAANAIDWSLVGERIGDRATPLKPKTLERIAHGLRKFAQQPVVMRYDGEKMRPATEEMATLTTWDMWATVNPFLMGTERSGTPGRAYPVDGPYPTQTGQQDKALVAPPPFLMGIHGDYYTYRRIEEEIPTCVGSASTTALIDTPRAAPGAFIVEAKAHHTGRPITDPVGTVIAGGNHHYLVNPPPFLFNYYGERHATRPVTDPAATVSSFDNHGLVQPPAMLIGQQSGAVARPVTEAGPTVAGAAGISLVVPAGGSWAERAADAQREAHPTQTAHETYGLAEAPHMLVPYHDANPAHPVSDPARTVSTREHEALCSVEIAVEDCRFRMLQTHEIQAAMAFPATYKLTGNKREQVKLLGNAVTPPVMTILLERCLETLAGAR